MTCYKAQNSTISGYLHRVSLPGNDEGNFSGKYDYIISPKLTQIVSQDFHDRRLLVQINGHQCFQLHDFFAPIHPYYPSRFTFWWEIRINSFGWSKSFYLIPGKTLFAEANVWVSREAEPANKFRFILPALLSSLLFVLFVLSELSEFFRVVFIFFSSFAVLIQ